MRYDLPKGNLPKVRVGEGSLFVFPGEGRQLAKKFEDHCTNETSEEKG